MIWRLACLFLVTTGCASAPIGGRSVTGSLEVAPAQPDTAAILRLSGRNSFAHACPISAELAITNAHVVDKDKDEPLQPVSWSALGENGLATAVTAARFRDTAEIKPQRNTFPRWYPVAKVPPVEGERVWFIGYDWRSRKSAFAERVFAVKVVRVVGSVVVMYPAGTPGSSGSCVLNGKGEVVAINSGAVMVKDGDETAGVAVGIWGPLLEIGK